MSKQMLMIIGLLVLVFGSGVGLGLFIGSAPVNSDASAKSTGGTTSSGFFADSDAEERVKDNTILSDRIRELEKELAEQKTDDHAILADRLAFAKKFKNQFGLSGFDGGLKVTPIMAEFLKLTPEEKKAIEQHLAQIQGEVKKIEQARITVLKQTDNSVTYEIPAFPEGKALKDQLNNFVTADIGDDRASIFLGDSSWEFQENFSGFGEGKTDIQITKTDQNAGLNYMLKETYANGSGTEQPIGNALPERFKDLIQLDPAPGP
jgi:hypothetical protein